MTPLFEHQKTGVAWLRSVGHGILADEMGLGKTRQAILAAPEKPGILVTCPASLKKNWEREIKAVYPDQDVLTIYGGSLPILNELGKHHWVIVNYDLLDRYLADILQAFVDQKLHTFIMDEAHYAKDTGSKRSKAALAIADKAEHVFALTGTPLLNRPIELFALLRAVKHPLGYRFDKEKQKPIAISGLKRAYSVRYCNGHMRMIRLRTGKTLQFWDETGANRLDELKYLTSKVMLRRTKKEVLDLPEKIVSVVSDKLDTEWKQHYDSAWNDYLEYIAKHPLKKDQLGGILTAQGLVELIKLRQVCSLAKIDRIVEDIQNAIEQEQKVIVFTSFKETVATLRAKLAAKKIASVQLTGSNTAQERDEAVREFQEGAVPVFVANIKAGGVGLNLTAASQVMFADFDWSPEVNHQAEDRAHRIGQEGTVNVYYYIIEDTIEQDMIDALQAKQDAIGSVTGGDRSTEAFAELLAERLGLSTGMHEART